jgi:hypothetical protein
VAKAPKVVVDQVGSEAFIVMGHDLPQQGFLDLGQFLLTLAKVQGEPGRYALGLPFLDLLPLKITLEGVGPLLRTIELSLRSVALCVEPRLGLTQVVSLLAKPLGHHGVLTGFRLQHSNFSWAANFSPFTFSNSPWRLRICWWDSASH